MVDRIFDFKNPVIQSQTKLTIQEAQQLARHTNINTTMIYAHNLNRLDNKAEQSIQNLLND